MGNTLNDAHIETVKALTAECVQRLKAGEKVMIAPTGISMIPFIIPRRDKVILQPYSVENALEIGDIAFAHLHDGSYVLHRIVKIKSILNNCNSACCKVYLMGDGNQRQIEECTSEDIIGIVSTLIRKGVSVDVNSRGEKFKAKIWMRLRPIRRYLLFCYRKLHP